ncbi:MAG: hypothetical protein HXX13_09900 [Bacteroidetes bacterium]|nr:hypothetical protein [Bacteroidota bacterium]
MSKKIESDIITIDRPAGAIFHFLNDFNNFSYLVPDNVINWEASSDHCSFEIKGLATLGMSITERQPDSRIVMKSEGKLPFDFLLISSIESITPDTSKTQLIIDADMNPFIAMMAEKPLATFVNTLAVKLKEVMEGR